MPAGKERAQDRVIVAITGASGALYGIRLLETLRALPHPVETHVVVSPSAWLTIQTETAYNKNQIEALADVMHAPKAIGASIASGSFHTKGMVIAPCSMHTLAAVAHGFADNLIARAADVVLKERRRLVLLTRETPLNLAHLRNMVAATEMGAIVMPPVPAFYHRPASIDDIINDTVHRVLDLLEIHHPNKKEWLGL